MTCTFDYLPPKKPNMKDFISTTELFKIKFSKILHICHFENCFTFHHLIKLVVFQK